MITIKALVSITFLMLSVSGLVAGTIYGASYAALYYATRE